MKADFLAYWNSLWNDIPIWVYETGILVFITGLVICSLIYGIRKGLRYSLGLGNFVVWCFGHREDQRTIIIYEVYSNQRSLTLE